MTREEAISFVQHICETDTRRSPLTYEPLLAYLRNSRPTPKVEVVEKSDVSYEVWLNNTFLIGYHRELGLAAASARNLRTALGIGNTNEQETK